MEASKDACPICLEGLSKEASTIEPCNHTFCLECITKWTGQNASCPLCLKQVDFIKSRTKSADAEDPKEEVYSLAVLPNGSKKTTEEEFECFDHHYFVCQFKTLLKQINDTEFTLKRELGGNRRKNELEKNYQLALNMKEEIQIKLSYLERVRKISPRDLLQDIQHFCDLLRKINYEDQTDYTDPYDYDDTGEYYEDEYYCYDADEKNIYSMYSVNVSKGPKSKKKSKNNKSKNKQDDSTVLCN